MQYLGGKNALAEELARYVALYGEGKTVYLEPFIGGGSVFAEVCRTGSFEHYVASDLHEDLVLLWQATLDGWEPPDEVTRETYKELKEAEPSALRGFAGFGCSFGAQWFAAYARDEAGKDGDPGKRAGQAKRGLFAKRDAILGASGEARVYRASFDAWQPDDTYLVYCDPPYAGTMGYPGVPDFDHGHFWDVLRGWVANGAVVLVSEFTAPRDWVPAWDKERTIMVNRQSDKVSKKVDCLFVHESQRRPAPLRDLVHNEKVAGAPPLSVEKVGNKWWLTRPGEVPVGPYATKKKGEEALREVAAKALERSERALAYAHEVRRWAEQVTAG